MLWITSLVERLSDTTFSWPWALLLLPLPLLLLWRYKQVSVATFASDAPHIPPRLKRALGRSVVVVNRARKRRMLMLWLAWVSAILAIAQPGLPGTSSAQPATGRAIVVAVDLSASMERKDFTLEGSPVNRLNLVKHVANKFILERAGDRVGLVLFGSEAFIASPPSYDIQAVAYELERSGIGMAGRTTAIGDALGLAIQNLADDPAEHKAIVLLSDGTNNSGSVEPESAAEIAKTRNIRVHTIALGSRDDDAVASDQSQTQGWARSAAADLDEETLQKISESSGGSFFRAATTEQLQQIYEAINLLESAESDPPALLVRQDWRNVFVGSLVFWMLMHLLMTFRSWLIGIRGARA